MSSGRYSARKTANTSINWLELLSRNNVYFRDEGPNCAKGHIVVKCPWCGRDDPSEHLGINLSTGAYGCWRDPSHRGYSPIRLLTSLLGVGFQEAKAIAGVRIENSDNFATKVKSLLNDSNDLGDARSKTSPNSLKSLKKVETAYNRFKRVTPSKRRHYEYLRNRGYSKKDIESLGRLYGIRCAISGYWKDRIIIPIYGREGILTWTARSIYRGADLRYLTLSTQNSEKASEEECPDAVMDIKRTLYNFGELEDSSGKTLFITEGPFDALRLDYSCRSMGVRATCLFGLAITEAQVAALWRLKSHYSSRVLLLDSSVGPHIVDRVSSKLGSILTEISHIPQQYPDPAEMPPEVCVEIGKNHKK